MRDIIPGILIVKATVLAAITSLMTQLIIIRYLLFIVDGLDDLVVMWRENYSGIDV